MRGRIGLVEDELGKELRMLVGMLVWQEDDVDEHRQVGLNWQNPWTL